MTLPCCTLPPRSRKTQITVVSTSSPSTVRPRATPKAVLPPLTERMLCGSISRCAQIAATSSKYAPQPFVAAIGQLALDDPGGSLRPELEVVGDQRQRSVDVAARERSEERADDVAVDHSPWGTRRRPVAHLGIGTHAYVSVSEDEAVIRAFAKGVPEPAAARRPLPPFTEEHEELRESIRALRRRRRSRPHVDEWEDARVVPDASSSRACGELGFLGLKYPEEYGGQGGDYLHDAVWAEELARCGLGRRRRRASAPTPRSRRRRSGSSAPRSRSSAGWCPAIARREDRRAGDHRARRRLRRRRASAPSRAKVDGGYVVNGSKTFITNGVRADFLVMRRARRPRRAATTGISFLVARDASMPGFEVAQQAGEAGLARLRHRRARVHRRRRARREPARRGERGLLPDHGQLPVGAAADGARRGRRDAAPCSSGRSSTPASARRSAARSASSRRSATRSPRWR